MESLALTALQVIVAFQLVLLIPPIVINVKNLKSNGRNNPFFIRMNKELSKYDYDSIFWQEWFECYSKKMITNFLLYNVSVKFRQDMELLGQSIEIEYTVRTQSVDEKKYRKAQARQLTRYDQFEGLSESEINNMLINTKPFAEKFVSQIATRKVNYIVDYIETMRFVIWWSLSR